MQSISPLSSLDDDEFRIGRLWAKLRPEIALDGSPAPRPSLVVGPSGT
jgi:hypothetical protein